MLKARVVSSVKCPQCKFYLKVLAKYPDFEFDIYDADIEENQPELDKWGIVHMPVVQIVDIKEDGTQKKVHQFQPGHINPRSIKTQMKMLNKKKERKQ